MSGHRSQFKVKSLADSIVKYDLVEMRQEVKVDFSPEAGSQRLLKQSEISARFRKRGKLKATRS